MDKLSVHQSILEKAADKTSFHSLLTLEGTAKIRCREQVVLAQKGDSLFVEAGSGTYSIEGTAEILLTYLEKPQYRIGIDLGGTNIKASIVNERNELLAAYTCKTLEERDWHEVAADMANAAHMAAQKAGISLQDCTFVGVGSPGTIDAENGVVVYSNNFPSWENIPLGQTLRDILHLPVKGSNDANCAALGEYKAGAAKGKSSAVLLTLGTGVGGGGVFAGKIFEGGLGGVELGHTILVQGGAHCSCGRRGCLEAYCSATALVRQATEAARACPESLLNKLCEGNLQNMDGAIPFKAKQSGDAAATEVVNRYIEWLGEGIVNMINIFRPSIVLISGGICGEGKTLTDSLNKYARQYAFGGTRIDVPEIKTATLGNNAGIVGAANL